jgi:hypothetical protein
VELFPKITSAGPNVQQLDVIGLQGFDFGLSWCQVHAVQENYKNETNELGIRIPHLRFR